MFEAATSTCVYVLYFASLSVCLMCFFLRFTARKFYILYLYFWRKAEFIEKIWQGSQILYAYNKIYLCVYWCTLVFCVLSFCGVLMHMFFAFLLLFFAIFLKKKDVPS